MSSYCLTIELLLFMKIFEILNLCSIYYVILQFLIGYNRGLIVLWDIKASNSEQTYNSTLVSCFIQVVQQLSASIQRHNSLLLSVNLSVLLVRKIFYFVTKVEKRGHLCPMDTFLVTFFLVILLAYSKFYDY